MDIEEAQGEVRASFAGGGVGAVVSGFVWLAAGVVTAQSGITAGFAALFIGGMAIFPLSTLICRRLLNRPSLSPGNTLGRIALESTIGMIGLFFAAYLFLGERSDLVLPLAAIAVGTHYFAFRSVYGDVTYWILGAVITLIGLAGALNYIDPYAVTAFAVAGVEILSGIGLVALRGRPGPALRGRKT